MRSFFSAMLCASSFVLFTGCATLGVTKMKGDIKSKPLDCKLDMYLAEKEISKPFEVVCLIDSRTATDLGSDRSAAAAIKAAKPEACKCGADGMLLHVVDTEGATAMTWGQGKAIIKAIRYIDAK